MKEELTEKTIGGERGEGEDEREKKKGKEGKQEIR